MLVPQPTSFTLSDPDSLHFALLPSAPSDLAPSFAPAHPQTRIHVAASASTRSRPTRQHRQRRPRSLLKSNSSAIYGVWDIQIKSGHRSLSKAKAKAGAGGSNRATADNKQTTEGTEGGMNMADGSSQGQNNPLHAATSRASRLRESIPETPEAGFPACQDLLQPSQAAIAVSNATTEWTVGQQHRDRINARSHAAVDPSLLPHTYAPKSIPVRSASNSAANARLEDGSSSAVADPLSARSKFLKAIGKFKSKHLLQKRPNSNTPAAGPETASATSHASDRTASPSNASSSHVPPPMHQDLTSDSYSVSTDSYVGQPLSERRKEQPSDTDTGDSALQSPIRLAEDRLASSSLRVKLKNRVHNTLASMKSSSNLRDRARLQPAAAVAPGSAENTPERQQHQQQHQQHSSSSDHTMDPQAPSPRARHAFWSFPRTRPDSTGTTASRQIPWSTSTGPSSVTEQSVAQSPAPTKEQDMAMLSPELAPRLEPFDQADVDDVNSDDSMDIIMPSDYDDYTQFAELPLKKRKKMLAAAAAVQDPSPKRPQASRMNSDAMKRFLLQQKSANDNAKGKKKQSQTDDDCSAPSAQQTSQKNSKKRPKDQDSIEQEQQQEPNKLAKPNSNELPEWRKAIMRSLHLGRGNQSKRNSKDSAASNQSTSPSQGDSTMRSITARRETLEMAMRRRRRSSAARSGIFGTEGVYVSGVNAALDDDAASTTNITHTFTSFTLELADIQQAHAIVNNSATPGLFNFKRQPRFTMSSVNQLDTDQEFKGFDSDGDAISGYTGDADVSMEDTLFIRPKTPVTPKAFEGRDKGKARMSGGSDILTRRRLSSIEGDSDTLPELPVLTIRTRDLNRSGSGGRPNSANSNGRETSGSPSPTMLSLEEVVSWKPRNILQAVRPPIPALNTKPLPTTRGSNLSTSSTLIASSRTPYSATSTQMTQSPSFLSSPTGPTRNGPEAFHHHRQQSSSSHYRHPSHYQQASSDTLIPPNHLKNFSTASTLSASSGYSAQTLTAHSPLTAYQSGLPLHHSQPVVEFDSSQEFPPTTPVDLKAMDFDTLLKTAEQEQRKGREETTLKKKKTFHSLTQLQQLQQQQQQLPLKVQRQIVPSHDLHGSLKFNNNKPLALKSSLSAALGKSASSVEELRIKNPAAYDNKNSGYSIGSNHDSTGGATKNNGQHVQADRLDPGQQQQHSQNRQHLSAQGPLRITIPKVNMALEAGDMGVGATGAARNNPRSRRVMKKKMSVIKLSGNVQGRREDDGMIRVSVASPARASS
ncbi:hypothetical protein BGZ70_010094 [Mortierella alpina]|uniref:Uncharacterized protein n=1 Tax=Mortierella alpina TaxID=64518 RepID=A0A9P6JF14_MORAP|nr:hypothetical protein BGZ70_010094 [Mortierella alpina]